MNDLLLNEDCTLTWWAPYPGGAYPLSSDIAGKWHDQAAPIFFGTYEEARRLCVATSPVLVDVPGVAVAAVAEEVEGVPEVKPVKRKRVAEFQKVGA